MRRGLARLTVVVFVLLGAPAYAATPLEDRTRIPLGTAAWQACSEQHYRGPAALACVIPWDPRYAGVLERNFDQVTPENEFKMVWLQPSRGRYDFTVADRLADFAAAYKKSLHGHALVWEVASPSWVTHPQQPWTRNELLDVMRGHVSNVVGHFRQKYPGVVKSWDVVNEPFTHTGQRERNIYERVIGDGWIEDALRTARNADPDALLYINEFAADRPNSPRGRALYALAKKLVERKVPLDGVGMQMHVGTGGYSPTEQELQQTFAQYALLGLRVAITEMDVATSRTAAGARSPQALEEQRDIYTRVARACAEAWNCPTFSVWGVADKVSWLRFRPPNEPTPNLFDENFEPKPAFAQVRSILDRPLRRMDREPNDRSAQATVRLTGPGLTLGLLDDRDDEDWYRIRIPRRRALVVTARRTAGPCGFVAEVRRRDGGLVASAPGIEGDPGQVRVRRSMKFNRNAYVVVRGGCEAGLAYRLEARATTPRGR